MLLLSVQARTILSVLVVTSVGLFLVRFRGVIRQVVSARPDPSLKLASFGRRIWTFFWQVLCQAKVIKERPVPGLAHAFVFWAFCVFALVSLNHLSSAYGLGFLHSRVYFWCAFAFAMVCSGSILYLAFRRFILRPRWLGPVSYESGVIAGLIFGLMLTYVLSETRLYGPVLWWSHTLMLLAFLPLIPHTKHLHLVLSPFTVFLKRPEFSAIAALAGDEDFGLVSGQDFTNLDALQAYSCVECGRCTEHCPANNTGKELNPKLIALGLRDYLNEFGNASEKPVVGATVSQTAIFQCTTCGACEYQCPVGIQHLPLIVGLRRGAVNTGTWEDEYGTKLFLNLERNGNAMGFAKAERDKFIARQELPVFDGSQEYCLWLGCMGSYDPKGREIISSFVAVMRHLGTSFGVLKKEQCTGDPVRRLGNDLVFGQLAEANLANFEQSGVKKIVSICPHCVRTMAQDWREFGAQVEIEHHSEFMARHSDRLPRAEGGKSVVYHDPCYLGRYRGVYDEPRELIARTSKLIEPERTRERSFCCGAGGGLVFLGEETGERVNQARARELAATGADLVGAACPFCNNMFRDARVEVKDIAQLVSDAILNLEGA